MPEYIQIILIIILLIFSAFFSGAETAYTSINRIKLKTSADNGDIRAKKVLKASENYDRLISTLLIGNNIVNIFSASIATVLFVNLYGENGAWISTIVMTLIVLVFSEVLPKAIAKEKPEYFAGLCNPLVVILTYVFLPLSFVLEQIKRLFSFIFKKKAESETFSEKELLTIFDELEEEGKIKPYENELIASAIKFDDIEVKEILTPRNEVIGVDINATFEEVYNIFQESRYTRIPVYHETIDNIVGMLHEKNFFKFLIENENNLDQFDVKKIMSDVFFLSEETKISVALKIFQEKKTHMGIVLDQFDGTLGIVTLEDIIEELVGEIFDETDEIFEEIKQLDENNYIVSGKEMLFDAFDTMGIDIDDEEENQTINSWLGREFGRIPTSGDNFLYQDEWKIIVVSANKKGAIQVRFSRIS